jgi:hypothetical protein
MKQSRTRWGWLGVWSLGWLCLWPAVAFAHHSFSMYDSDQLVKIEGAVKEFQWTNPHVLLWVTRDAPPGGSAELWTIELPTSPGNLSRMNWSKRSLKPGDRVVVSINPLRDGKHGGSFKQVLLVETGQVLVASAPPVKAVADAAGTAGPADGGSVPTGPEKAHASGDTGHAHDEGNANGGNSGGCGCQLAETHRSSVAPVLWLFGWVILITRLARRRQSRMS